MQQKKKEFIPCLGGTGDGQRVDAVGIAVTVAGIRMLATVAACPHKY